MHDVYKYEDGDFVFWVDTPSSRPVGVSVVRDLSIDDALALAAAIVTAANLAIEAQRPKPPADVVLVDKTYDMYGTIYQIRVNGPTRRESFEKIRDYADYLAHQ
jgi:hypothetical protein